MVFPPVVPPDTDAAAAARARQDTLTKPRGALGRKVARRVDEKFPDNTESRWKLGLYAASRASQMRRMRAPRPQVKHGARVE